MRALALFVLLIGCGGQPTAIAIAPATPSPTTHGVATNPNPPPRPGSNVRVHVIGAHAVSEADLAAVVEIDKPGKDPGASNRDVLERDTLLVQAALYDRGFIQSKVNEPSVAIGSDGVIDVTFTIEEGLRFRLSKVDVEEKDERTGKLVTPLQSTKHAKVGEWFSRRTLVEDIMLIQTTYRDAGYGIADVVPETQIDPTQRTIDVKIVVNRGPIVTYNDVRVDPPDALIAAEAARRIGVTAGARFSETKLTQVKTDLASKGVRADISTQQTRGKPDAVDVTIEVH